MRRVKSFALMRFFGWIGFGAFANVAAYYYCQHLGFDGIEYLLRPMYWFDQMILFQILGIGIVAGLIGLVIGQTIGHSISVSRESESWLLIFWHYGAMGTMVWLGLSFFVTFFCIGKDIEFLPFIFWAIVLTIGLLGSWAIALFLHFGGRAIRSGSYGTGFLFSRIMPVAIGVITGIIQADILGFPGLLEILAGLVFPFITIPISAHFRRQDEYRLDRQS